MSTESVILILFIVASVVSIGVPRLFDRIEHIVLILLLVFLTVWAFARWKGKLLQGHRFGEDGGPSL